MSIRAGIGLSTYPFTSTDGFWRWVQMCEEGDIDSIWQTDTLVSKEPMLECMTTMAAIAGATKKLKFGMNVASVALRNPLVLAKQCATIDVLSNGRILPAFGIGSTFSADWRTTGTPTKRRGKRTDEGLEIISRLWKGETVTLDGEFFQYDGVRISPLPVQKELPLWIGGSSDAAVRRTIKYGTGWQASFENPEQAGITVEKIKQGMTDAGREFEDDHFGTGINFRFGKWDDDVVVRAAERFERVGGRNSRDSFAVGGAEEVLQKVQAFADAGLPKLILRPLASDDKDTIHQTKLMINEIQPGIAAMN
ncbi:MAG: LLM class flavin-dependent oxidoreductase [Rhodospirillaceae bacterium]|jgi:probable F420-dependent oxidoreductase|nr:LLM class flavin-dependent oxidoreductase [Rhodospirillaceae bacterium]MBT5899092.1 LLM class flavin-dependent oxidoreductase [Rhodospirillaceae bacterium]MBT6429566.1 LLM class flavin-dependent oxidoreductase [Rhodospirillaceae bacterium]MBT7758991.1 LLM class flavin-dependent oxidoreductase [Rhodospirillaceae bacterium]